jgi:hypothetical protein
MRGMNDFRPELVLALAGFRIGLAGAGRAAESGRAGLRERFGLFVEAPDPPSGQGATPLDLEVTIRSSHERQYLPTPQEDGHRIYRLESRVGHGRLEAWSYSFRGSVSLDGPDGELAVCETGFEPPARSIENFLRVALAWKAAARGALLLHAAGVVRDGRAFVFFGPSGSGKTTVTRFARPGIVLNDDIILLTRAEGGLFASGVPFKGSDDVGVEHPGRFPLAGLFRLSQATEDRAERIPLVRAVGELAGSVPFVTDTPGGLERTLGLLEGFAREVPVFVLRFRKSGDFWDAVERAVPPS